jgi:hypothetical protein
MRERELERERKAVVVDAIPLSRDQATKSNSDSNIKPYQGTIERERELEREKGSSSRCHTIIQGPTDQIQ